MIWILVGVVVVCLVAIVVLVRRQAGLSEFNRAATKSIEDTKAQVLVGYQQLQEAQARLVAADERVTAAQMATEQANGRAALAESGLAFTRQQKATSLARAQIEALWVMASLEQSRAWRLTMALPQDATSPGGPNSLATAMAREIDRIREETGTPGRLTATVPDDLDAGDAVIALKAIQGLMAVLTRYSDAFDLTMGAEAGRMVATLVCENFDGPDTVADEATALLQALQSVGGEIDVDRDDAGRLEARLTVPLSPH